MKTLCLIFLGLCVLGHSFSQKVIATSGDYNTTPSGNISWTVGEISVETLSNGVVILTQGFHQGDITFVSSSQANRSNLDVLVYPNPSTNYVTIRIEGDRFSRCYYMITDIQGKILQQKIITSEEMEISLKELAPAVYFLRVYDNKKEVKLFRIVKLND